jgi:RNA polymerase sigma-54 factor
MTVGLKQELRQSQQLVMTQQLQQSIKLLQLSAAELAEFIDQEIEKNPLLSREDATSSDEDAGRDDGVLSDREDDAEGDSIEAAAEFEADFSSDTPEHRESMSAASDDSWQDGADGSYGGVESAGVRGSGNSYDPDGDDYGIEQTLTEERSLRDHLLEQLQVDVADPVMRLIGAQLIDMIDDTGYLRDDMASLAETLGADITLIEHVIQLMQRFDPVGVFARSLEECLRIQLEEKGRMDEPMKAFLANMHLLAEGNLQGLRKLCGVDEEELQLILADVRSCNPRPASHFTHDVAEAVTPDVLVRRNKQGWMIELNPETLPRVLINQSYATQLSSRSHDKEAKKYLGEQMQNASWLVKALNQRAETILKVSHEIVKQQEKFFLHGIRFLKPLVLKDIAAAVGMHESTISRVTTHKYMATPRGTFELKYFFTSSIGGAVGDAAFSSKTVMYYIRELIDAETAKEILSDDAIVTLLKDRNIDVARRTVTKYREAMHIPSSVVRRRQKNAAHVG